MRIFVRNEAQSKDHSVEVEGGDSVSQLKTKLASITGIPADKQILTLTDEDGDTQPLDDGQSIVGNDIRHGDTIHLAQKPSDAPARNVPAAAAAAPSGSLSFRVRDPGTGQYHSMSLPPNTTMTAFGARVREVCRVENNSSIMLNVGGNTVFDSARAADGKTLSSAGLRNGVDVVCETRLIGG